MKKKEPIFELLKVMARLRSPAGCPWDREQNHLSLRYHAVEEVYELIDAIESGDDHEMAEELGDLLLQVVFHCQLAAERQAFDFETVCRQIVDKLIRRHPHVFGDSKVQTVEGVWAQWEHIKNAEKSGTRHERSSALDGIPRRLPALQRAEKLVKKARKAGLLAKVKAEAGTRSRPRTPAALGRELFALAEYAQRRGWSAENALRTETKNRETDWRGQECERHGKKEKTRPRRV